MEYLYQQDNKTVSRDTIRRVIIRKGYRHLVARKKGIVTLNDTKLRMKFAKK